MRQAKITMVLPVRRATQRVRNPADRQYGWRQRTRRRSFDHRRSACDHLQDDACVVRAPSQCKSIERCLICGARSACPVKTIVTVDFI
jgi:hypothetical protein